MVASSGNVSNLSSFKPMNSKDIPVAKLKALFKIYEGEISGGNSSSEVKQNFHAILNALYDRKMIAPKTYNDLVYKYVSKKRK